MIFRKNVKKGGGGISDLKNFIAILFALETAILVMNFRKNLKKGGGHFRSEKFHCKFGARASGLRKKSQCIFRKRGGVLKGRSKIHPFWRSVASLTLPLQWNCIFIEAIFLHCIALHCITNKSEDLILSFVIGARQ